MPDLTPEKLDELQAAVDAYFSLLAKVIEEKDDSDASNVALRDLRVQAETKLMLYAQAMIDAARIGVLVQDAGLEFEKDIHGHVHWQAKPSEGTTDDR